MTLLVKISRGRSRSFQGIQNQWRMPPKCCNLRTETYFAMLLIKLENRMRYLSPVFVFISATIFIDHFNFLLQWHHTLTIASSRRSVSWGSVRKNSARKNKIAQWEEANKLLLPLTALFLFFFARRFSALRPNWTPGWGYHTLFLPPPIVCLVLLV